MIEKFHYYFIVKKITLMYFIISFMIGFKLESKLYATSENQSAEQNITTIYTDISKIKELIPILDNFFNLLAKKDAYSATKDLFKIFPISQDAKDDFVNKITFAKTKLGNITGHEFVGYKKIGLATKLYIIYWFSYHELMPILWEFTFYKPNNDSWQLNYIRFESDDIMDFLTLPRLMFEKLRSELSSRK